MDSSDISSKEMWRFAREGFAEVRTKLDSIYNVVVRRGPKTTFVQDFASISSEPRARNVQVPPTAIDAGREDINSSL